jgi:hypothetical protein
LLAEHDASGGAGIAAGHVRMLAEAELIPAVEVYSDGVRLFFAICLQFAHVYMLDSER